MDLHSKVDSQNSGIFVATTKDDGKLGKGSGLNLALAAEMQPTLPASLPDSNP